LIYTAALGEVPASLPFIEYIPGCIELYLANQGGMEDDLSHDPYVSGNLEASALPKVSNVGSWRSGVVGQFVAGLCRGWCTPNAATYRKLGYILVCVARPADGRRTVNCAFLCWEYQSLYVPRGVEAAETTTLMLVVSLWQVCLVCLNGTCSRT
jgi:hypothetical protein